jgi:hypothetical protein
MFAARFAHCRFVSILWAAIGFRMGFGFDPLVAEQKKRATTSHLNAAMLRQGSGKNGE